MKGRFLLALVAGLVAAATISAVAVAAGAGGLGGSMDRGVRALQSAAGGGSAPPCLGDGPGPGPAFKAIEDPELAKVVQTLREQHRAEMRAWWDHYGDDRRSDEARQALDTLRAHHREEVRAAFEKYGVELPDGARLGAGGGARAMFESGAGHCGAGRDDGQAGIMGNGGNGRLSW
jgi:hypothetical protein